MPIRIIIADDHPIVRSGIRNELGRHEDLAVVGEALDGDESIALCHQLKPDILLLDIQMPGKKAIEVVHELTARATDCRILVLSAHGDTPTIIGMLKAGVKGYILKDEDPTMIPEAVRAVCMGDTWLSPGVSDRLGPILVAENRVNNRPQSFTRRELQVLRLVATGSTTREICASLQMAERTVEFHITNILRKLDAKGRLEAAMKAREQGIL